MTKEQALKVAENLSKAVLNGLITEEQAKNRFKLIVRKYQYHQKYLNMQKKDPITWTSLGILLGE